MEKERTTKDKTDKDKENKTCLQQFSRLVEQISSDHPIFREIVFRKRNGGVRTGFMHS